MRCTAKRETSMSDSERLTDEPDANATGILLCLRMLADEAADLRLQETLAALRYAITACEAEHLASLGEPSSVH